MAAVRSSLMGVLLLTVMLHISVLCGVISMGTDSTAVTIHENASDEEDAVVDLEDDQEILEIFQPTDEWQTIKEDQAIPAGLHVRINLATGLKEAKYLDKHQDTMEQTSQDEVTRDKDEESNFYEKEELKERLAKVKGEDECQDGCVESTMDEALIEEVKQRYRSIAELKKQFSEINMDVKTDYEIMKKLFEEYKEHDSIDYRNVILQDLEFYVHKVDNGVDLASLGGWEVIISALNSSEEVIHTEAARVLGSAVQSNPKAQVSAFDNGAMQPLIRLLSQSPSIKVKKSSLYGLSSLVRLFPYAQKKFIELGGLSVLSGLLRETSSDYLPLKIKSMTLVHDLLVEQREAVDMNIDDGDEVAKERKLQYQKIKLVPMVIDEGWCDAVPKLLNVQDHDMMEKILSSIDSFHLCCDYTSNVDLHNRLRSLREEYKMLADEESLSGDGDDFFHSLWSKVDELITTI